jgi:glutamine synthetase
MTVLNTIVAEAVDRIAGEMEKALKGARLVRPPKPGEHTPAFHNALQKILAASLKEHKRVVFNGNGYESDWPAEAAKRGLPNAPDTPSALAALGKKENAALFEKYGVMTARELESRREIALENYTTKVMIEGNAALDLARTMFIPVVKTEYRDTLAAYGESEKHGIASGTASLHEELVTLGAGMDAMRTHCAELEDALGN